MQAAEPYVLAEIASQPDCWLRALESAAGAAQVLPAPGERVAVIGCGTSWHIASAAAAAREAAGHGDTDAFAASEFPARAYDSVVAISRSGETSEVLRALRTVPSAVRKIGITAEGGTPIGEAVDQLLVLDYADEQSVVQTRFATTALALLRAHLGHDLGPAIQQARTAIAGTMDSSLMGRQHYAFLGTGWALGVAREAALKVQEAAGAWSEAFPALEYRHGPIAAATENSVVWMLGVADDALAADVRRTGATLVLAGGDPQAELVRIQRLAVATAQLRELDPDRPRYLGRAVVLADR